MTILPSIYPNKHTYRRKWAGIVTVKYVALPAGHEYAWRAAWRELFILGGGRG